MGIIRSHCPSSLVLLCSEPDNSKKFGKLYNNWYAVNDKLVLVPEGWHIPGDDERTELINFLRGEDIA